MHSRTFAQKMARELRRKRGRTKTTCKDDDGEEEMKEGGGGRKMKKLKFAMLEEDWGEPGEHDTYDGRGAKKGGEVTGK